MDYDKVSHEAAPGLAVTTWTWTCPGVSWPRLIDGKMMTRINWADVIQETFPGYKVVRQC